MRLLAQVRVEAHAVELTIQALGETRAAFDGVACTYDRSNEENPIIRMMRDRARLELTSALAPGSSLIDLGCGPGADAVSLARLGYHITAIDWSPAMVEQAAGKVAQDGVGTQVQVRAIGIHELERLAPDAFDGAYSNFGPLNCVPDLAAAARGIAARLRPGGVLVASVIGRVCPWEIARYGLAGDWRRIRVRFSRGFVPVPLEGRTVWTRYYTPAEFARAFRREGFRTVSLRALGLLVPPPYLQAFYERHTALMDRLARLEDVLGRWPGVRQWGDHFLLVMRKS
jgi:SAM-dependent methyltransferase